MEERRGVCLAEEAERLWRSGSGIEEVARRLGVDAAWVQVVVGPQAEGEDPDRNERPSRRV